MWRFLSYLWMVSFGRKERGIFRFWDGRRWRTADPIPTWRALADDPEFLAETHLTLVDGGDLESVGIVGRAVRRAFGVPEFNQGGLTERQCVDLLESYYSFIDSLKKKQDTLSTSPSPTVPPSSAESTTPPAADCFSTSSEPKPDSPLASSGASANP